MSASTGTGSVSPCADLRARQPAMIPPCGSGVLLAGDAAPLELRARWIDAQDRRRPMRRLPRVLVHLHTVEQPSTRGSRLS
jgi:hypothetical protein